MQQFDVIVVGGGMVGAAAACGFAQQGKSVLMVERQAPIAFDATQAIDLRVSALAYASIDLLKTLQAWEPITAMRSCPYQHLQAWDDPKQVLNFSAEQLALPYLGHMVENRIVQLGLWQACRQWGVNIVEDATPQLLENTLQLVTMMIAQQHYQAKLLVVADGAQSALREQLGIGISAWDYRQRCLSINVKLAAPQQDTTWQQFCPSGPRSLLPLPNQHAALIWYDSSVRLQQLQQLNKAQLKQAILQAFPPLAGDFDILDSASFALTRRHALRYTVGSAVLLGDAAHTINPLAGQGVNLGFRDVKALLDLVDCADWPSHIPSRLQQYSRQRKPDNLLMQGAMDCCYWGFSNSSPLLKGLRSFALGFANRSGKLKDWALHYALGLK